MAPVLKKRGRPTRRSERTKPYNVALTPTNYAHLVELAADFDVSSGELLQLMIEELWNELHPSGGGGSGGRGTGGLRRYIESLRVKLERQSRIIDSRTTPPLAASPSSPADATSGPTRADLVLPGQLSLVEVKPGETK